MSAEPYSRHDQVRLTSAVTYIAADRKRRKTADGAASHFTCLSSFWSWWSAEENMPNPMAGLPRPKTDGNTPIPVLSDEQLAAVYDATAGVLQSQVTEVRKRGWDAASVQLR
jgi:site-specific recombinase XerD